jgi:hypothetical protein
VFLWEDELRKLVAAYFKLASENEAGQENPSDDYGAAADIVRRLAETKARCAAAKS